MVEIDIKNLIAESIISVNTSSFTSKLMVLIDSTLNYDSAVILGLRVGKRPFYLYDSDESNHELLFNRYLISSFNGDPFYQMLITNQQQGIFSLKDVEKGQVEYQHYLTEFYMQTGWLDELCVLVETEPEHWIIIFLGCTQEGKGFSKPCVEVLKSYFRIIQSLCQQHWKKAEFHLAEAPFKERYQTDKAKKMLEDALCTFGKSVLSQREQQILLLILKGLGNKDIADYLGISEGTVKNHRKRVYAKLHVTSMNELFQLFLNYFITQ